jgi:formiminoglutamase
MHTHKYYSANPTKMSGRVDSQTELDKLRIHQQIEYLNIFDNELTKQNTLCFGLVSYCVDEGVKRNKGRAGAGEAPSHVLKYLASKPFNYEAKIFDCGIINQLDENLEAMQNALSEVVAKMLELNIFPIVIGGGHDMFYGGFGGTKKLWGKTGIISFDAHFDNRAEKFSTSGTMFNQINTKEEVSVLTIGVSEISNTESLFNSAVKNGINYITDDEFNFDSVTEHISLLNQFIDSVDHVYLTICTDVFPMSIAPGVSATNGIGINFMKFLEVFKTIAMSKKLTAFDIAEISPKNDLNDMTSILGASIISKLINYITKR